MHRTPPATAELGWLEYRRSRGLPCFPTHLYTSVAAKETTGQHIHQGPSLSCPRTSPTPTPCCKSRFLALQVVSTSVLNLPFAPHLSSEQTPHLVPKAQHQHFLRKAFLTSPHLQPPLPFCGCLPGHSCQLGQGLVVPSTEHGAWHRAAIRE